MVTETAPAVVTESTPSADASLPGSDERLEVTPPALEDQSEAASQDGDETDDTPPTYDPDALQAKIDAGDGHLLTTPEKEFLKSHNQSKVDQEQARTLAHAENQRVAKLLTDTHNLLEVRLSAVLDAEIKTAAEEERAVSPTILRAAIKAEKDAFTQAVGPLYMRTWDAHAKAAILEIHPDKAEAQKVVNGLESSAFNFNSTLQALTDSAYKAGQGASPEAKENKTLKEQVEKLRADLAKATGARGKGNSPAGDGKEPGPGPVTYSQILKMTDAQIAALPSGEFERALSAEAK